MLESENNEPDPHGVRAAMCALMAQQPPEVINAMPGVDHLNQLWGVGNHITLAGMLERLLTANNVTLFVYLVKRFAIDINELGLSIPLTRKSLEATIYCINNELSVSEEELRDLCDHDGDFADLWASKHSAFLAACFKAGVGLFKDQPEKLIGLAIKTRQPIGVINELRKKILCAPKKKGEDQPASNDDFLPEYCLDHAEDFVANVDLATFSAACAYGHIDLLKTRGPIESVKRALPGEVAMKAILEGIEDAVKYGHHDVLKYLLKLKLFDRITLDKADFGKEEFFIFMLHHAVENGYVKCVEVLLNDGVDPNAIDVLGGQEGEAKRPLVKACDASHIEMARLLIARGARVNEAKEDKTRPIFAAASANCPEIVGMLLDGGEDKDVTNNQGFSVLMTATMDGSAEVVARLIQAGANVEGISPHEGDTALVRVTSGYFRPKKMTIQLIVAGANVNAQGLPLLNAVRMAAITGDADIVRWLIKAGANVNIQDRKGVPLLVCAIVGARSYTKSVYKDLYGQEYSGTTNVQNHRNEQLKKNVAAHVQEIHVKHHGEIIVQLLDNGADINALDANRLSPLDHAIRAGDVDVVSLLLAKGARTGPAGVPLNPSLLLMAIYANNIDVVRLLIKNKQYFDAGAQVRGNNLYARPGDFSPLHTALSLGRLDIAEELVAAGASMSTNGRAANFQISSFNFVVTPALSFEHSQSAFRFAIERLQSSQLRRLIEKEMSANASGNQQPKTFVAGIAELTSTLGDNDFWRFADYHPSFAFKAILYRVRHNGMVVRPLDIESTVTWHKMGQFALEALVEYMQRMENSVRSGDQVAGKFKLFKFQVKPSIKLAAAKWIASELDKVGSNANLFDIDGLTDDVKYVFNQPGSDLKKIFDVIVRVYGQRQTAAVANDVDAVPTASSSSTSTSTCH